MPIGEALDAARARTLDLVEIAPLAVPPVVKIMDYGKYIFQQKKKLHESKKKQKLIQVKEVKFRPRIDAHDYDFKKRNIIKFLEAGDKVKMTVQFRGREMTRQEFGRELVYRLVSEISGIGTLESGFEMMGNRMHAIIAPVKKLAHKPEPAKTAPKHASEPPRAAGGTAASGTSPAGTDPGERGPG
jgi:translation initiation factor IF-3